jgi:hypothetical protein
MNPKRMQDLIAAYGADPSRWPQGERLAQEAVQALAAESPALAEALARAHAQDADLDAALPVPSPSAGLRARILAQSPQPRRAWWRELSLALGGPRLVGPAFACAFSLGLALVWMLPPPQAETDAEIDSWLALAWIDPADSEELP